MLIFLDYFWFNFWLCCIIFDCLISYNQSFLWSFFLNDFCFYLHRWILFWTYVKNLRLRNILMLLLSIVFRYFCCDYSSLWPLCFCCLHFKIDFLVSIKSRQSFWWNETYFINSIHILFKFDGEKCGRSKKLFSYFVTLRKYLSCKLLIIKLKWSHS